MGEITVIIIDDHPLFRQGVADALSLEDDFMVVGQTSSGEEGLILIREKHPSVAIIDVNLPDINGQQLTRLIVLEKIPTRVLLLTAYDDSEQQIHAMRAGAAAFCTKDIKPENLVQIIRKINSEQYLYHDQVYPSDAIGPWYETKTNDGFQSTIYTNDLYRPLSAREMEVLSHITRGLSNKEIATLLGISHQTVKNHVTSILRKLGVEDRTQATIMAIRLGWVRLHESDTAIQES